MRTIIDYQRALNIKSLADILTQVGKAADELKHLNSFISFDVSRYSQTTKLHTTLQSIKGLIMHTSIGR